MIKTNDNKVTTLENIEVVEGECSDCYYYKDCGYEKLTAINVCVSLIGYGKIFKKKGVWVQCTKENTKVGDTIRGVYEQLFKVKYICNDVFYECYMYNCLVEQNGKDRLTKLEWYEVKEK